MNTPRRRRLALGCLSALVIIACHPEDGPVCSDGMRFDAEQGACIGPPTAPGTYAVTVGEADLGFVIFKNIEVPDSIKASYPQRRSLTIQNPTDEDWGPFTMRVALSKRWPDKINGYLNHVDADYKACADACTPGDADCASGCLTQGENWGCNERADPAGGDPTYTCQKDERCDTAIMMCHPETETISSFFVEGLAAGASIDVDYQLSLPANWTDEDDFTYLIFFDEEDLIVEEDSSLLDENGAPTKFVARDPDAPDPAPGANNFHLATAVYVHPDQIQVEVDDPTIDGQLKVATSMLELDDTLFSTRPAFVANLTLSSLGLPLWNPALVEFSLKLPGHEIVRGDAHQVRQYGASLPPGVSPPGPNDPYDAQFPNGSYNAERTFKLQTGIPGGQGKGDLIFPVADVQPAIPQGIFVEGEGEKPREGTVVDRTYALHLDRNDVASLAETLKLRAANQTLDNQGQIAGTLQAKISYSYKGRPVEKVIETPVVFKAPEVALNDDGTPRVYQRLDTTTPNLPDVAGIPDELPTDGASLAPENQWVSQGWEVDHITPTWYKRWGGPWLGAEAQVKNFTAKFRYKDAVVRQAMVADDFLRVLLLNLHDSNGNELPFPLLHIDGVVDWGSLNRNALGDNQAKLSVKVPASFDQLAQNVADAILDGTPLLDALTNTLVDLDLTNECMVSETEPGLETCSLIPEADDEPPDYLPTLDVGEGYDEQASAEEEAADEEAGEEPKIAPGYALVEYVREKSKKLCKPIPEVGPFCVKGTLTAGAGLGIVHSVDLFRKQYPTYPGADFPEIYQGVQASIGPKLLVSASASGELSLLVMGVTLTGTIVFIEASLEPTLRVGLAQELVGAAPNHCWRRNTGRVAFLGPAYLDVMQGNVKLEAWAGLVVDLGFLGTIDLRRKVVDFTLYEFGPLASFSWELWNESVDFRGEGLCPDLDTAGLRFATPIGCKTVSGEDGYCPKAEDADGYDASKTYSERLYTGPSGCGTLIIDGNLEPYGLDEKLGKTIGDYVEISTGPTDSDLDAQGYVTALSNPGYPCAVYRKDQRVFDPSRGSVVCGKFGTEPAVINGARQWRYSGEFNDFRLDFCKDNPDEKYRWVEVSVVTDNLLNTKGLAVRLEPQEGREGLIRSAANWEVSARPNVPFIGHYDALGFKPVSGPDPFGAARVARTGTGSHWAPTQKFGDTVYYTEVPVQVAAPFTAAEADGLQWIWNHLDGSEQGNLPPGETYGFAAMRRPFIATSDAYYVRVYCFGGIECRAKLSTDEHGGFAPFLKTVDGGQEEWFNYVSDGVVFKQANGVDEKVVRTRRGEPHLLYIEARHDNNHPRPSWNADYSPGPDEYGEKRGVAVLMKPVVLP